MTATSLWICILPPFRKVFQFQDINFKYASHWILHKRKTECSNRISFNSTHFRLLIDFPWVDIERRILHFECHTAMVRFAAANSLKMSLTLPKCNTIIIIILLLLLKLLLVTASVSIVVTSFSSFFFFFLNSTHKIFTFIYLHFFLAVLFRHISSYIPVSLFFLFFFLFLSIIFLAFFLKIYLYSSYSVLFMFI